MNLFDYSNSFDFDRWVRPVVRSTDVNLTAEFCFQYPRSIEQFAISRAWQHSVSVTEHFQMETENAFLRATTNIIRCRCGVFDILAPYLPIRVSYRVSWSLTSPFSTNMAISETKGQRWRAIRTQWREAYKRKMSEWCDVNQYHHSGVLMNVLSTCTAYAICIGLGRSKSLNVPCVEAQLDFRGCGTSSVARWLVFATFVGDELFAAADWNCKCVLECRLSVCLRLPVCCPVCLRLCPGFAGDRRRLSGSPASRTSVIHFSSAPELIDVRPSLRPVYSYNFASCYVTDTEPRGWWPADNA